MRVITYSRFFPNKHSRAGELTNFVERIWRGLQEEGRPLPLGIDSISYHVEPKWHTFRAGFRWSVGQQFSPRIWIGIPYRSKQMEFAEPITIKKIWTFEITTKYHPVYYIKINNIDFATTTANLAIHPPKLVELAKNDGLSVPDFLNWFAVHQKRDWTNSIKGQILCWNDKINYV